MAEFASLAVFNTFVTLFISAVRLFLHQCLQADD